MGREDIEKEHFMSYAKSRKDAEQDFWDEAASLQRLKDEQFAAPKYITHTPGPVERHATAMKREREAFYGKYSPENGICPECNMILSASGSCTGFCFD